MKTTEDIRRKLNEAVLPDKSPIIASAAMFITEEILQTSCKWN